MINKGEIMKFEFTEGQWFDGQKLSDWQKQWCLDNLKYASEGSFRQFKEPVYNLLEFRSLWGSCGSQDSFGTVDGDDLQSENEITFNAFYWGEDEEVTQESIFETPRWVTVKGEVGNTTSFFGYQLICGKDYKVVNQSEGGYDIQLTPTKIIEVSKEYFHKVTPEDLKPVVDIEEENSFDNLTYVEPEVDCRIKIEKLSDEQKRFLNEYLVWEDDDRFLTLYSSEFKNLRYCSTDKTWWLSTCGDECSEQDINFNQIFQEVTTHQD